MALICKVTARSRLRAFVYYELAEAFTYTLRPMSLREGKTMVDRKWAESVSDLRSWPLLLDWHHDKR